MFATKGWKIFYGLVGAAVISVMWFTIARPVVVLPRVGLSPGYTLLDATGRDVTSEDARGKVTLYTFAYSGCGEDCRPIYASLRALDEALAAREPLSPPFQARLLTLDPARDTPAALAAVGLPFEPRALDCGWLTGNETWLRNVVGSGFQVLYSPRPDGTVFFAPRYVLVDGEGLIRSIYEGAELDTQVFLSHLDLVYKEIQQSHGANRLAYEAAHLFACYVPQH